MTETMNCLFVFFPFIFHWIAVLSSKTPPSLCPIHFLCLFLIVSIRALSSPIIVSTSEFVIYSVQLSFSTHPHIQILLFYIFFSHSPCLIHTAGHYIAVFFYHSLIKISVS